jgi:hypothetical protein
MQLARFGGPVQDARMRLEPWRSVRSGKRRASCPANEPPFACSARASTISGEPPSPIDAIALRDGVLL